mmetsp:Transcript_30468/g.27703  ORF Transcript_30468/g.27703 Transcript_30468/m.27703 type:complete len:272 (+) Transcript_30468:352-1167(+)
MEGSGDTGSRSEFNEEELVALDLSVGPLGSASLSDGDNNTAFVGLFKELLDALSGSNSGMDPDSSLQKVIFDSLKLVKDIKRDIEGHLLVGSQDIVESEFVDGVVLKVEGFQGEFVLDRVDLLQEGDDTITSNEVESESEGLDGRGLVGCDTSSEGAQTFISNSIVAEIDVFNGGIDGKHLSKGSSTIYVDLVAEDIKVLEGFVLLQSVGEIDSSSDTQLIVTDVEDLQDVVLFEDSSEGLGTFLLEVVLSEVQDLDVGGEVSSSGVQREE